MINICHQYRHISQNSLFHKEFRIIYRGETPSFNENDGNTENQEDSQEELLNTQVQKTLEHQRQSIQTVQNSPLLSPQEKEAHAKETAQLNKDTIGPDNTLYLENTIIFPGLREIYGFHLELHVSQENIQTYQSLDKKISAFIQDQKFDEAISAVKDFIEQNPKFPAKNILEISLVEAVLQKIESIQEGNSLWAEGGLKKFLDKHFDFINQRLANLTLRPNGKESVTFYLESLYQSGRIDRQNPLFHKLLLISPEFEEKENNKLEGTHYIRQCHLIR
jgi:hypothetical protein